MCLPRWVAKIIKVVGVDARDINYSNKIRRHKQHVNVSIMVHVILMHIKCTWLVWMGE